jgi:hypothetical protein
MGSMVLSRFHTLDHRFHRLVIVDPDRFNTPPSQYFIFKNHLIYHHLSILKVFLPLYIKFLTF